MAKRLADIQITKDGHRNDSDSEEDSTKIASQATLSKRKILMPKSRRSANADSAKSLYPSFNIGASTAPAATANSGASSDESKPVNAFAGFAPKPTAATTSTPSIFGNKLDNATDTATPNPFALFKKTEPATSTLSTSSKPLYPTLPSQSSVVPKSADENGNEKSVIASQIKALNDNFMSLLTLTNKQAPLGDYTDYCEKYIKYFKQIREGSLSKKLAFPATSNGASQTNLPASDDTKAIMGKSTNVEKISTSDSDADDDKIEIKGPSFTTTKKISDPVFKFGASSNAKSDVQQSGPSFTFNAAASNKPDTAFTWGKKAPAAKPQDQKPEDKRDEQKNGASNRFNFSIGSTTPKFSFGKLETSEQKTEVKSAPSFSFGSSANTDKPTSSGFSFSFSKPAATSGTSATDTTTAATDKSALTTPALAEQKKDGTELKTTSTPFTLGASKENDGKPSTGFSFGSGSKPAFSVGASNTDATKKGKSEDGDKKDGPSKPVFNFGNSSTSGFSFGAGSSSSFNFGGVKKNEADKESAEKKDNKPSSQFRFGGSNPGFNFGASTNSNSTTNNNGTTSGFGFGANSSSKPVFNFGGASSFSTAKSSDAKPGFSFSQPAESKDVAKVDDNKTSEETANTSATAAESSATPAAASDEVLAGEENEEVKYNKKCKLLFLNGKEYVSKGLGFLKVLENPETHKTRMLLRSEGSQRVILNQYIIKGHTYVKNGNAVQVPVVEEGKVKPYYLRVKDGAELMEVLNKCAEEAK